MKFIDWWNEEYGSKEGYWYDDIRHMVQAAALKAWSAAKPAEPVAHVDNNRFMTALKVCEEWRLDKKRGDMSFQSWCRERLNAPKAEHFTKR